MESAQETIEDFKKQLKAKKIVSVEKDSEKASEEATEKQEESTGEVVELIEAGS